MASGDPEMMHGPETSKNETTQAATLEEARENLKEAVQLVLEANRELAEKAIAGKEVSREPFDLTAQ